MINQYTKVVHITTVHYPLDTRIYQKQCKTLENNGFDVSLIAKYHENLSNLDADVPVKIITLSPVNNRLLRMSKSVLEAYKIASKLDANIYHLHDPELIPLGLLLKIQGKRVIYDVHEDYPKRIIVKHWIPDPFKKLIAILYGALEIGTSRLFNAIICTESDVQKRLGDKAIVIENAPLVQSDTIELAYKYSKNINKDNSFRVVFVGGLTEVGGLFNMVKAMELVNQVIDSRLWLGGLCPNEDEWKNVQNLPGWKYVDYLGYLTQAEAYSYVLSSDVGLITYLPVGGQEKANPNKIYEYQRFGIPFIASNFDLWTEKLEDVNSGMFVDSTNVKSIADAILYLHNNKEEAIKMGRNGQAFILEHYNWDLEAKKLLGLYGKIIKGR